MLLGSFSVMFGCSVSRTLEFRENHYDQYHIQLKDDNGDYVVANDLKIYLDEKNEYIVAIEGQITLRRLFMEYIAGSTDDKDIYKLYQRLCTSFNCPGITVKDYSFSNSGPSFTLVVDGSNIPVPLNVYTLDIDLSSKEKVEQYKDLLRFLGLSSYIEKKSGFVRYIPESIETGDGFFSSFSRKSNLLRVDGEDMQMIRFDAE